jgi:C-terminal processing protease CtpA/Prc
MAERYCGIGVAAEGMTPEGMQVSVHHGSPAQLAGLRSGEVISHIFSGKQWRSVESEMDMARLIGMEGSEVSLRVLRGGSQELEFSFARGTIVLNAARGAEVADIPWTNDEMRFQCSPMAQNQMPQHGLNPYSQQAVREVI